MRLVLPGLQWGTMGLSAGQRLCAGARQGRRRGLQQTPQCLLRCSWPFMRAYHPPSPPPLHVQFMLSCLRLFSKGAQGPEGSGPQARALPEPKPLKAPARPLDIDVPLDVSDIPAEYVEFLKAAGTHTMHHKNGRSSLSHLSGTYRLLKQWGNPERVCAAGLFHNVYGTAAFRRQTFSLNDRERVRSCIGHEAEHLAHLFCIANRPQGLWRCVPLTKTTRLWKHDRGTWGKGACRGAQAGNSERNLRQRPETAA